MSASLKTLPERDQDSYQRAASLKNLPPGAHVHISGICGTGTAAVAVLLKSLGYRVSGSDKAFYPPMGDVVRTAADTLYEEFSESNLEPKPDLVVIGNALSRGNPEVEFVLNNKRPFASMPEVFEAKLIGSREECAKSVVVIGTHGKTTTSALIVSMLEQAGRLPGYFIGGLPKGFSAAVRSVNKSLDLKDRVVVLEGDEYDSAFFAKWPKFHSYRPDVLLVTSLEFDHADIFDSIEQIEVEFTRVAARVPAGGCVLVWNGDKRLEELAESWRKSNKINARVLSYGSAEGSDYKLGERAQLENTQRLSLKIESSTVELETVLAGEHNASNVLAAAAVGETLGLSSTEISQGLAAFRGVARRLDVIFENESTLVMEDFAHHPTEVAATLKGLKERYPKKRLVAVFEPRSNTSRRGYFQEQYERSFGSADLVVLKAVEDAGGYSNTSGEIVALDTEKLTKSIQSLGIEAISLGDTSEIKSYLLGNLKSGDLVVFMSNGDFGGLPGDFIKQLSMQK